MAQTRKQASAQPSPARAPRAASEDGRVSGVVQQTDPAGEAKESTTTLRLPVLTVAITRHAAAPESPPSGTGTVTGTQGSAATASRAGKFAFYGGIAALGVLGVVEWPVAAALGAGALVLSRMRPGGGQVPVPSEGVEPKRDVAVTASSAE